MTDSPSTLPRHPGRTGWTVAVVLSLLIGMGGGVLIGHYAWTTTSGDRSSSASATKFAGYGQTAATVAKKLTTCSSVKVLSKTAVRCVDVDGDYVAIIASDTSDVQDLTVAMIKDQDSGDCAVVIPGVIFSSQSEDGLTEVLGIPEKFAADNGGYTLCPIP